MVKSFNNFEVSYKDKDGLTWRKIEGDRGKVVFPFSFANFLDERLDEAYITVYQSNIPYFKPTTEFQIVVNGNEYYDYVLADDKSIEMPLGSGKYKHTLYLIEMTKLLEGFQCQSLTFTNQKAPNVLEDRVHTLVNTLLIYQINDIQKLQEHVLTLQGMYDVVKGWNIYWNEDNDSDAVKLNEVENWDSVTEKDFSTIDIDGVDLDVYDLVEANKDLYLPPPYSVFEKRPNNFPDADISNIITYTIQLYKNGELVKQETHTNAMVQKIIKIDSNIITPGLYAFVYSFSFSNGGSGTYSVHFDFEAVPKKAHYHQNTMTDCINRVLNLAEPLFKEKKARFKLNRTQEDAFSKIMAPEFSLTQCNLREQLKVLGNYLQSEPRLRVGMYGKEIYFEKYNLNKKANIGRSKKVYGGSNWSINDYCTELRSSVQNLINSRPDSSGAIVEPAWSEYKSLRTEDCNVRITEDNAIVETDFPIYTVEKVECALKNVFGKSSFTEIDANGLIDITRCVLEETEYSLRSSYSSLSSRDKALYYTRGQKHIKGLFFQSPHAESSAYAKYAISNVIVMSASRHKETLILDTVDDLILKNIPSLVFRVTYKPIFSAALTHGKQKYDSTEIPYVVPYNQSDNYIEQGYYGEHLKSVAQRMGNVTKEITYIADTTDNIPKAGEMLGEYCITSVNANMLPTHVKYTLGLSKDFNRISEYIGVNSLRRTYEISERQVSQRDIILKEYIVIGDSVTSAEATMLNKDRSDIYAPIEHLFEKITDEKHKSITTAYLAFGSDEEKKLTTLQLPVMTTSFGNTMNFRFAMKDNYSAGQKAVFVNGEKKVRGSWGQDVAAFDELGKARDLEFALCSAPYHTSHALKAGLIPEAYVNIKVDEQTEETVLTPIDAQDIYASVIYDTNGNILYGDEDKIEKAWISTKATGPYKVLKDNRECLSITVSIEFMTNRDDLIVGSALASKNCLVNDGSHSGAYLFGIKSGFEYSTVISNIQELYDANALTMGYKVYLGENGLNFDTQFLSSSPVLDGELPKETIFNTELSGWVIAYPLKYKELYVVDDYGEEKTIKENIGGDVLLLCSKDYNYSNEYNNAVPDKATAYFLQRTHFSIIRR